MNFWLFNNSLVHHYPAEWEAFTIENRLKGKVRQEGECALSKIPELTLRPKFRDVSPLSQEEIAQHSRLEEKGAASFSELEQCMKDFPSKEHFWLRVLANFLGGGLITGGSGEYRYDGFDILPNFKIWKCLLTDVCNSIPDQTSPEAKNLLNILNGISLLEECAEELDRLTKGRIADGEIVSLAKTKGQKISELVPGQSLLMVGGWSNTGGKAAHAMIYEFVRREDQLFDIYLYSGAETALTEIFLIGDKRRVKPVVLYEAVPEHVLLQNRDGILRPAVVYGKLINNIRGLIFYNKDEFERIERVINYLICPSDPCTGPAFGWGANEVASSRPG